MLGVVRQDTPQKAKARRENSDDCTPDDDWPRRRLRDPIRCQRRRPGQDANPTNRWPRPRRRVGRQRRGLGPAAPPTQEQESPAQGGTEGRPLRAHRAGRPARHLRHARHRQPSPASGHDPGHRALAHRPAGRAQPPRRDPDRDRVGHSAGLGRGRFSSRVKQAAEDHQTAVQPGAGPRHPFQLNDHGPADPGPLTRTRTLPRVCHG